MRTRHEVRHAEQRAATDADQAEKAALLYGSAVVDAGVRDEIIAEALDEEAYSPDFVGLDNPSPGRARWHRRDLGVEGETSAAVTELQRRSDYLGEGYPFRLTAGTLTYVGSPSGFYEYCLGISVAPNITTGEFVELPRTFERVVGLLTQLHMGGHCEFFHTGHPRDEGFGKWHDAMQELHKLSGEWWWNPDEGLPEEPTVGGDGGVDFIVWKKPGDPRPGSLFVVAQCACGNDWPGKLNELDLDDLGAWFGPLSWVKPVRAFATPFVLSDGNFQAAHRRAGWVFDRVRLTAMAELARENPDYMAWRVRLNALVDLSLERVA